MVVAGPLAITAAVKWWFINLVDSWMTPLVPLAYRPETYLPFRIPGFGLLVALVGLTLLGFLTANLVAARCGGGREPARAHARRQRALPRDEADLLHRVLGTGSTFRTVGLVQYPAKGMWSIVFLSKPAAPNIADCLPQGEEQIGVFLPCSPNPTTGFFLLSSPQRGHRGRLTPDEAAKLVMSAGLIQPDELPRKLARGETGAS